MLLLADSAENCPAAIILPALLAGLPLALAVARRSVLLRFAGLGIDPICAIAGLLISLASSFR